MTTPSNSILDCWLHSLQSQTEHNLTEEPSYYAASPQKLVTTSQPGSFVLGTGSQLLSNISSNCLATNHELIIVTCFWAKSPSQETISSLLLKLSAKAVAQDRKIQVRICFSSLSLLQKLFQTASLDGKIYPPASWVSLGLPAPEQLLGLDLVIKSVFVRPFSVMHPKFIIVDRQLVYMPSCNVSWENWFEGCIEMHGGICKTLLDFWFAFWAKGTAPLPSISASTVTANPAYTSDVPGNSEICRTSFTAGPPIPTILLPSPHHANPSFRPFWLSVAPVPPTPLNTFLLHIISTAKKTIFIQTPNITSAPLISALLSALKYGINVHLITSSRLMILEQLVTAGTITEFELWKLRRKHKSLLSAYDQTFASDPEAQALRPGSLRIGYFHSRSGSGNAEEPVKSHLKCVIVDEGITVLGSGNMDRASWFTSQELGVAFLSGEMAVRIQRCVGEGLEGRVDYVG